MFFRVELASRTVTLEEPADCKKFHVEAVTGGAAPDMGAVTAALGAAAAQSDDAHVWITEQAVRDLAAGRVPESWAGEFDGMLGYARSKGWVDASGAIQAHVEWV
ncbi:MAG: hypothetical protein ACKVWR_13060 [Acidimicrobiales bacterium]